MYKLMTLVATVLTAAVLCGCASVSVVEGPDLNGQKLARSGKTVAHLQAENWGIYLFMIPLITGSTDNFGVPTLVTDTVSPQALTAAVTKQAKSAGARTTADLVTDVTSAGFIFYYRGGTASGTAVK